MTTAETSGAMDGTTSTTSGNNAEVTYYRDIKAILDTHCVGCHHEGGVAPASFESIEEATLWSPAIASTVAAGVMPPWQVEPGCREIKGERRLTEHDQQQLIRWEELGAPAGDPADTPDIDIAEPTQLGEISIETRGVSPYLPSAAGNDDYRCIVLDAEFGEETRITGYEIVPDVKQLVHHAALFLVESGAVGQLEVLEAEDGLIGYPCFGGPGVLQAELMGSWLPGSGAQVFPDNTAYVVPAGSKVVMQVHYNVLVAEPVSDWTAVRFETTDLIPEHQVIFRPMPNLDIFIPAGEPQSSHPAMHTISDDSDVTVFGFLPHMHLLGRELRAEIVHADGSETCLMDIRDWDFNWQESYEYMDSASLAAGEPVRLTCVYDNSPANQPVIDGDPLEPRDVSWGEGTLDEMCVGVLATIEPYTPSDAGDGACTEDFPGCDDACEPTDGLCTLSCAQLSSDCANCFLPGMFGCGGATCPDEQDPLLDCMLPCISDSSINDCLSGPCAAEFDVYWACLQPELVAGACNDSLANCGVSWPM